MGIQTHVKERHRQRPAQSHAQKQGVGAHARIYGRKPVAQYEFLEATLLPAFVISIFAASFLALFLKTIVVSPRACVFQQKMIPL